MSTATCHTEGCENQGASIDVGDLTRRDDEGRVYQISDVICGVCSQPITDIKR